MHVRLALRPLIGLTTWNCTPGPVVELMTEDWAAVQ